MPPFTQVLLFSTHSLLKHKLVSLLYSEIPNDLHLMQNKEKSLLYVKSHEFVDPHPPLFLCAEPFSYKPSSLLLPSVTEASFPILGHARITLRTDFLYLVFPQPRMLSPHLFAWLVFFLSVPFSARTPLATTPSNRHYRLIIAVLVLIIYYYLLFITVCILLMHLFYCLFPPLE